MEKKRFDIVDESHIVNKKQEINWVGVISNDVDKNYYFRTKSNKKGDKVICVVYNTITDMMQRKYPLISYLWTAENDSKLLDALTDGTPLEKIQFDTEYMEI